MAARNVGTLTFDWPGHGASPVDGAFLTVENCLADLEAVIRTVRGRGLPLYLFATSFGGFLGVNYVNRNPGVFSRIVLRAPALNMPDLVPLLLPEEQRRIMEDGGTIDFGNGRPLLLDKSFYEDHVTLFIHLQGFYKVHAIWISSPHSLPGPVSDHISPSF